MSSSSHRTWPCLALLESIHPLVKFGFCFFILFKLSNTHRLPVLAIWILESLLALLCLSTFPKKKLFRMLVWILGMGLFCLFVYTFTSRKGINLNPTLLWQWHFIKIYEVALFNGIKMALRLMGLALGSFLFVATTSVLDLLYSLIQQLHLPYRLGYSIASIYRSIPLIRREYQTIRSAQRIRGLLGSTRWTHQIRQFYLLLLPLLASAIRRAERLALAMEARAFVPGLNRTYYRKITLRTRDVIFILLGVTGNLLLMKAFS